jgi:hypothetical protein
MQLHQRRANLRKPPIRRKRPAGDILTTIRAVIVV